MGKEVLRHALSTYWIAQVAELIVGSDCGVRRIEGDCASTQQLPCRAGCMGTGYQSRSNSMPFTAAFSLAWEGSIRSCKVVLCAF